MLAPTRRLGGDELRSYPPYGLSEMTGLAAGKQVADAASAQAFVLGVAANVGAIMPAALAFWRTGGRHADRFVGLAHFDGLRLRSDEHELEVVAQAGQHVILGLGRLDHQLRLQRRADGARGAQ